MSGTDAIVARENAALAFGRGTATVIAVLGTDQCIHPGDRPTDELDGDTEQLTPRTARDRAADGCATPIVTHSAETVHGTDRHITLPDGRTRKTPEASDVRH
ncbi:hypothetical protein [Streptomyces sp. NPDC088350]|uniref:hypothetical protein n=1 Tax=Streptomyces sp. NPDC088350 TaxID=3365854 RepID=UPI003811C9A4